MITCSLTCTVFFDGNVYKCILEYRQKQVYQVCQLVFYSEPKEQELYDLITKKYHTLVFGCSMEKECFVKKAVSPKRQQRSIARQLHQPGVGTKAMQLVKASMEENQRKRKKEVVQKRIWDKEKQFLLHQEKRKQKHRGH